MPGGTQNRRSIGPAGRSEARAASALTAAGAGLVALSLILPHPSGGNDGALAAIAVVMAAVGTLGWLSASRIPIAGTHALIAAASTAAGLLIYESGVAAGQYGTIWVWGVLIASYYFPRRVATAHLIWLLAVYAATLATVENTAGFSPLTRWFFSAVSLGVVMVITTGIVARRARADARARRFFDLSNDMLCTMDMDGRCVELNAAWRTHLGYGPEDLEGVPLLEITHPGDHKRAVSEAMALFAGRPSEALETRVRAKDGSWHWLRTSAALSTAEGLVYARSTDVTELKRIEAEREQLLGEVQVLARSDALTGLPSRRTLQEQLPREMARARRGRSPLSAAILDIDHFKVYNDTHGHLAGDEVLRLCAVAWDSALRGGDTIVRFGGEEFLVVLPDTDLEEATAIVERLREATPMGQTCSAGVACWDYRESVDDLLGRADEALYLAKASGRDQVAEAAPPEASQS